MIKSGKKSKLHHIYPPRDLSIHDFKKLLRKKENKNIILTEQLITDNTTYLNNDIRHGLKYSGIQGFENDIEDSSTVNNI